MRRSTRACLAAVAAAGLLLGTTGPASAATSGKASNRYVFVWVDLKFGGYLKVCDTESDGQRVRAQVWSRYEGRLTSATDASGADGLSDADCGIGYFNSTVRAGDHVYLQGWRQNGPSGRPHDFAEATFTAG